ncbi:protein ORD [Stomoxys calcitrans]|uniref:Uncharacterized protein n=1 Tax=Stomoxys calcitrans TaxID=35570 RepID=A0A1I8P6A5_STOCA|nr:protein ORD [Stomoxys calcitrans]
MKITELEIENIGNCKQAHLKFDHQRNKFPIYLVQSATKCEVITWAIQLVCTNKYDSPEKLEKLRSETTKLSKVTVTFRLGNPGASGDANAPDLQHSSDSDEPCTSQQFLKRLRKRQERKGFVVVKAIRNFLVNENEIEYRVEDESWVRCPVDVFQRLFFSCTDIIFPRLSDLQNGECNNGRWLGLLRSDFVSNGTGDFETCLIEFCEMFVRERLTLQHQLCELTNAALKGIEFVNKSRMVHLVYILQDIRCVFEYISCSEYTVWYMIPTFFGIPKDITEFYADSINFSRMTTKIQLQKPAGSPQILWNEAEGYVKELFMVAIQLAFGYHCRQNVIFLHDLEELNRHQSFEYVKTAFGRNTYHTWVGKNYLRKIIDICTKFDLSCIVSYAGGIPFQINDAFIIQCEQKKHDKYVSISLKNRVEDNKSNMDNLRSRAEKEFGGSH